MRNIVNTVNEFGELVKAPNPELKPLKTNYNSV